MGVGGSSWIEVARSEGSQSNVIKCNKESRWIRLPESVSKITKKTMPWVSTFSFFFYCCTSQTVSVHKTKSGGESA